MFLFTVTKKSRYFGVGRKKGERERERERERKKERKKERRRESFGSNRRVITSCLEFFVVVLSPSKRMRG
jgi:hypothetical protein